MSGSQGYFRVSFPCTVNITYSRISFFPLKPESFAFSKITRNVLYFVFPITFKKIVTLISKLLYMFYFCSDSVVRGIKFNFVTV